MKTQPGATTDSSMHEYTKLHYNRELTLEQARAAGSTAEARLGEKKQNRSHHKSQPRLRRLYENQLRVFTPLPALTF